MKIPVIDFAPFLTDEAQAQRSVAESIYRACHEVGFFYLRHHGIPPVLVEQLQLQSKRFFDLPDGVKRSLARSAETNCGYVGLRQERLDPGQPGDLKEAFNVGLQAVWPPDEPDFRAVVSAFYDCCRQTVAPNVLRAFAIALDLPPTYFDDKHGQNYFLRLLHYPPIEQPPAPGQLRAGAHTDYGSITLLLQNEQGGLEVQTRDGQWIAAPPLPETVVVNVGDAMQRWTNDRLRSTPHRVCPCDSQQARYSVAVFCDPNPDVVLACLPGCATPEQPPRYAPMLNQEHLNQKLNATY
ncbi:MAG: 2OG-Fe(II) oxygenase family protein [Cyanobacteria bacterium J06648_16]